MVITEKVYWQCKIYTSYNLLNSEFLQPFGICHTNHLTLRYTILPCSSSGSKGMTSIPSLGNQNLPRIPLSFGDAWFHCSKRYYLDSPEHPTGYSCELEELDHPDNCKNAISPIRQISWAVRPSFNATVVHRSLIFTRPSHLNTYDLK